MAGAFVSEPNGGPAMRRERFVEFAVTGCLLYGSLYIAMVFAAGLVASNKPALVLAIGTAGLCYLNCAAHAEGWSFTAVFFNVMAIAVGALAGIMLLVT